MTSFSASTISTAMLLTQTVESGGSADMIGIFSWGPSIEMYFLSM